MSVIRKSEANLSFCGTVPLHQNDPYTQPFVPSMPLLHVTILLDLPSEECMCHS